MCGFTDVMFIACQKRLVGAEILYTDDGVWDENSIALDFKSKRSAEWVAAEIVGVDQATGDPRSYAVVQKWRNNNWSVLVGLHHPYGWEDPHVPFWHNEADDE